MKLLVFGKTGQVASELQRAIPSGWNAHFFGREDVDLELPGQCAAVIRNIRPDAVINAAAYTAVDKAEDEPDLAHLINAEAPAIMARAAKDIGAPFLHISTDYVFNGSGTEPFAPDCPTGPLGMYGQTKLAGEAAIQGVGGHHLVLRTSWVFSVYGANFLKTMLRFGAERDSLSVVDDQIGGPTPASAIATALLTCAKEMKNGSAGGLYHFAGAPFVSWAEFARAIMAEAELDCRIDAIDTSGYPTKAKRPGNSRLDCSAIERDFGIVQPDWRTALPSMISELNK